MNPKAWQTLQNPPDGWPVFLWGNPGVGKSFAAALFFREWPADKPAQWWRMNDFLARIAACRTSPHGTSPAIINGQPFDRTEEMWFRVLGQQSLVVFDDVGIRSPTDAGFEVVFTVADLRPKRPTVYTSNVDPRRLKDVYDERIASRMLAGTILEMTGTDRRVAGKKQIRA